MFLPAIGVGGLAGWRILQKTAPVQQAAFERSPSLQRNIAYFRENIKSATSAEALVNDRRLLNVALGAFGLADEINKKGLILKMLEGGTKAPDALANRFADPRYKAFVKSFDYADNGGAKIQKASFHEDIIARYKTLEFERALGESDNDMRLAMNFKREIADVIAGQENDITAWFHIMGRRPVREVVAAALNIPTEVSRLELDRQQEIFSEKTQRIFGDSSPQIFKNPETIEDVIRRFFLNRQLASGPTSTTPGFAALNVLQAGSLGPQSASNLLLSQI